MAEHPIGERTSAFVSWIRWLAFGLVLAGVSMAAQRWPWVGNWIGIAVLVLVAAGLALWAAKELFEDARDAIETLAHTWDDREARHDRR